MSARPRTAIILANGPAVLNGFAIAPYPKILLPIANHTLLEYQAGMLASVGVRRLIISGSHECTSMVRRAADQLLSLPMEMEIVGQANPRGTAGTLKEVEHLIVGDSFWVLSGDLFCNPDLERALTLHRQAGATASVGAVNMEEPGWHMERVEIDQDGSAKMIHRIHPMHTRRSKLRPIGLYLFERAVLDVIPSEGFFDIKEQLIGELYSGGHPTRVWAIHEYCQSLSSLDKYFAANWDVLLGRAEFHGMGDWTLGNDGESYGTPPLPGVTTFGPVSIGTGSRIREGAVIIGPTCIGENCEVESGVVLNCCILFSGVKVGRNSRLSYCLVVDDVRVEPEADMRETVVLRDSSSGESLLFYPCVEGARIGSGQVPRSKPGQKKRYLIWKRLFDTLFSLFSLIFTLPLMIPIAIAIKLDSEGEIIFRQRRCGQHGRNFNMYKFRTMVSNAEDIKRTIQYMNEVDGPMFKIGSDPRVTRVGRFLRSTNLDELPQFVNVLLGHMALVGPRPLSIDEMRFNPKWRDIRLSVKPGLIGLWQLHAHDKPTFMEWIRFDTEYVFTRSAWMDFKIILLFIRSTLVGMLRLVGRMFRRFERHETGAGGEAAR